MQDAIERDNIKIDNAFITKHKSGKCAHLSTVVTASAVLVVHK
jgi:hypothetical protein